MASRRHVRVAIVGTGFAGLGMAIQLRRHGIDDFLVIERADDVGGTWRDNTYPGAACDIRSDLYSFSFFPKPDWANHYAQQPEILEYLRSAAKHFDLYPQILFGAELESASWDDDELVWQIRTSKESFTATVLVAGAGPLIDPKWPEIIGLETFTGPRFHSARWDHGVDLADKTIAVIGTGASSIQFVPELQKIAARVTVFQRSAPWVLPRRMPQPQSCGGRCSPGSRCCNARPGAGSSPVPRPSSRDSGMRGSAGSSSPSRWDTWRPPSRTRCCGRN
jgi:cation diffusion facilitator CzcD-associated flavoprotein CzcO